MRTTFRRTLAAAVGAVALTVGLGLPAAQPAAAAADCYMAKSVGTASTELKATAEGSEWGTGFSNVKVRTPGYCSASSVRFKVTASWSGGSATAYSTSTSYDIYQRATHFNVPHFWVDTPGGSGVMTLTITRQSWNGYWWWSGTPEEFYINVPGDFDTSQEGTFGGSCTSGPVYGTAKWC